MGSITERERRDRSIAYRAEIVIRRDGRRHKASQTFNSEKAAERWMKRREKQLRAPGGLDNVMNPRGPLADPIERYIIDYSRMGRTKAQVLRAIKEDKLADLDCAAITSEDVVDFARRLGATRKPQTVFNYLSHLSAVFSVARPAYGFKLDAQAMQDGMLVCRRLSLTEKSAKRDRRPTLDEMNALMTFFEDSTIRTGAMPTHVISAFAMFATRRQEEVCRIVRADYQPDHPGNPRIMVRDMKHPGEKKGNDVWTELPLEANAILAKHGGPDLLFPYNQKSISTSFTRACKMLGIEDLHFHDLRHEGVSRLFEMGRTIPQVAQVSGHRSWQSLQRYTHLSVTGDKWADWGWLNRIT